MKQEELNQTVQALCKNSTNYQEFADICSIDQNWENLDKSSIAVGKDVLVFEGECPECDRTIRTLHPKFCQDDTYRSLRCPHCQELVGCHVSFSGYTCEMTLEAYDEEVHSTNK